MNHPSRTTSELHARAVTHAKRPTVLVTGFEPFGGEVVNPSAEIARSLDGREIDGRVVVTHVLPCRFATALRELRGVIRRVRPEVVVCVGQAGGRLGVSLERVALNVIDARVPDNDGVQPVDAPVVRGGPTAYWSTLPLRATLARLESEHIPASLSESAGTFVCNQVFYGLMHALEGRTDVRAGFVHVPYLPEQLRGRTMPSLALDTQVRALAVVVECALRETHAPRRPSRRNDPRSNGERTSKGQRRPRARSGGPS